MESLVEAGRIPVRRYTSAVQVVHNRLPLRLQAEAGPSLPCRRYSQVRNELAFHYLHPWLKVP